MGAVDSNLDPVTPSTCIVTPGAHSVARNRCSAAWYANELKFLHVTPPDPSTSTNFPSDTFLQKCLYVAGI